MIYLKKFFTLPDYTDEAESRQAYFLYIISSSRNGLNMVNLVPTKETNVHVQACRQD
jgi:hypothetical protein